MNPALFPPSGARSFTLRFDFAIELGLLEEVRAPVCQESFEELRFREPIYANVALEDYNIARSRFVLPRFLNYFGAVAPGQSALLPWIADRWVLFSPPKSGLWNEMIKRAYPVGHQFVLQPVTIYAVPPEKPIADWTLPGHCVVHDTRRGVAAVVSWKEGHAYLDLNGQS